MVLSLKELINKLHKDERDSSFVQNIFSAVYKKLIEINDFVEQLKKEFFFDTLSISLSAYEKLMKITTSSNATVDERRSAIWARWRANGKNTIKLIQDVCNAWQNGEIKAQFVNGKIKLQFVGAYGIPSQVALNALITQINEIIPAHIGYFIQYKFLLKKDIHKVLTKAQMQQLSKNKYCEVGTK
jgi:hypothetical protein